MVSFSINIINSNRRWATPPKTHQLSPRTGATSLPPSSATSSPMNSSNSTTSASTTLTIRTSPISYSQKGYESTTRMSSNSSITPPKTSCAPVLSSRSSTARRCTLNILEIVSLGSSEWIRCHWRVRGVPVFLYSKEQLTSSSITERFRWQRTESFWIYNNYMTNSLQLKYGFTPIRPSCNPEGPAPKSKWYKVCWNSLSSLSKTVFVRVWPTKVYRQLHM